MRRLLFLLAVTVLLSAHIGSPDVWYVGPAGPYDVRVLIRPPTVVPGLADIVVRVSGGAERVLVVPAQGNTGPEREPPPDVAKPMSDDPETFTAQLWLMARGPYRITVKVSGARGEGTAIVPVTATATERKTMSRLTSLPLLGACAFLFFGLVWIIGAGVREGVLPPGREPDRDRARRARIAMALAACIIGVIVFGGWRWWSAVDGAHRRRLDRPWNATASLYQRDSSSTGLAFAINDAQWLARTDSAWLYRNPGAASGRLIPDHGKLMHMFIMREPDHAVFAHVHPRGANRNSFVATIPRLPAGDYRIYADIVEESGTTRTVVARTSVRSDSAVTVSSADPLPDEDDAAWSGAAAGSLTASDQAMDSITILRSVGTGSITAGEAVELTFDVLARDGSPVPLEPYMGMAGHAVVARDDGEVFVHLHPLGTISTAAQQALGGSHVMSAAAPGQRISFPYAFPTPGRYRVWVQVRSNGRILTGAHDVTVQ
jgi:hypothetical protein